MKRLFFQTISTLALLGGITVLSSACGGVAVEPSSAKAEPQIIVITATPTPTQVVEPAVEMTAEPTPTVAVKVAVVAEEKPIALEPTPVNAVVSEQPKFQLSSGGDLQPASTYASSLPVAEDGLDTPKAANLVLDLPAQTETLTQTGELVVHLNSETQAANLRTGPGLTYEVVKVVLAGDDALVIQGRTLDGWLKVTHQGDEGWLAANLVEAQPSLSTLPLLDPPAASPEATPAPVTETVETVLQPVICYETPIRGFGKVWGEHPEVQARLNCPSQFQEQGTNAAIQQFQHGWMLWLESDTVYSADPVYVFFNDGTYQRFGDLGPADPAKVGETPEGFFEVGDKFGKVYWEGTGARVKERLGYAITPAADSPGAFQQFYNGRMFWAGTIDRIFVIYDYYEYTNDQTIHISAWEVYDDTF